MSNYNTLIRLVDQGASLELASGTPLVKCVPGSGSFVITIDNKHAADALNGTLIFGFLLIKA